MDLKNTIPQTDDGHVATELSVEQNESHPHVHTGLESVAYLLQTEKEQRLNENIPTHTYIPLQLGRITHSVKPNKAGDD